MIRRAGTSRIDEPARRRAGGLARACSLAGWRAGFDVPTHGAARRREQTGAPVCADGRLAKYVVSRDTMPVIPPLPPCSSSLLFLLALPPCSFLAPCSFLLALSSFLRVIRSLILSPSYSCFLLASSFLFLLPLFPFSLLAFFPRSREQIVRSLQPHLLFHLTPHEKFAHVGPGGRVRRIVWSWACLFEVFASMPP